MRRVDYSVASCCESGTDLAELMFAPGLIVTGSDGLGSILGLDTRKSNHQLHSYVLLDPVWMELDTESVRHRGTFDEQEE